MSQSGKREFTRVVFEIIGLVAVIVVIVASAFSLISRVSKKQKLLRVDSDVTAIVSGVRMLFSSRPNFDNLTFTEGKETPEIKCEKVMEFIGYKGVTSPFGGEYMLTAIESTNKEPGGAFEVFFYLDTPSTCKDILKKLKGFNGNIPGESYCNHGKIVLRYSKHG